MKRFLLAISLCAVLFASIVPAGAEPKSEKKKVAAQNMEVNPSSDRLEWWTDARFGMFIHWGLYALPARHEWVKQRERITDDDYQKYFDHFDPDLYNPREWARQAKAAGMKYVVLTSKHHEGFCLWDSKYTEYKVTNTPFGRDIIKDFVEAFRDEGLKVGFYYSLIDWHHPDFTIDNVHPQRLDPGATRADYDALPANKGRDMDRYRQYMKNQVTELLTNYGKIDIMWFDFSYPGETGKGRDDWDSKGLLSLARSLQPDLIVDDRMDLKDIPGGWDFLTPEQYKAKQHPTYNGVEVPWETCQTFSGSWGYYRDEATWKNSAQLLELLIETVSKGGNLIMNVGPTGRGEFDDRAQTRLCSFADWMHFNSRSIYGCAEAPKDIVAPERTILTYNAATNRLYIHLVDYPLRNLLIEFADRVEYAQFLHDASEIKITRRKTNSHQGDIQELVYFELPVQKPHVEIPVIEVFLKD